MGILAIQFIMIAGLIVFTTLSIQYVQEFIKATAVSRYREDVDLQNIVDFIQVWTVKPTRSLTHAHKNHSKFKGDKTNTIYNNIAS